MYSIKKVHKTCWYSRSIVCKEKRTDWILKIFTFNDKNPDNTSHKFWNQSPYPHYQCFFQLSETVFWHKLRSYFSSNMLQHWVEGRGLIYICKVDHSRISISFPRNWLGLNNLYDVHENSFIRCKSFPFMIWLCRVKI